LEVAPDESPRGDAIQGWQEALELRQELENYGD
jgi:hypothetical protein